MLLNHRLYKKLLIIYQTSKIALRLIIIDQITKWWFILYLKQKPGLMIKVSSFLDFVYVWNYGISFGFFKQYYQYSNYLFISLNSLITLYLWRLLLSCSSAISFIGYNFIIGGAIGNLIDRIYRGAVFDFIYFHYHTYSFAVFNLADSFISIGVALILYEHYKNKKIVEKKDDKLYDAVASQAEEVRKTDDYKIKYGKRF